METPDDASLPLILLVDDQPVGLRALVSVFERQGYELVLASDGAEAIASLNARRPDLVLLDVMMPVMDGFEVCRTIRSTPATSTVPVILVTAYDDREARLEAQRSGADDLVAKPIDRAELRMLVQKSIRHNQFRTLSDEGSSVEHPRVPCRQEPPAPGVARRD